MIWPVCQLMVMPWVWWPVASRRPLRGSRPMRGQAVLGFGPEPVQIADRGQSASAGKVARAPFSISWTAPARRRRSSPRAPWWRVEDAPVGTAGRGCRRGCG